MINLAMLANNRKHEIVQIKVRNQFSRRPLFDAVRTSKLEHKMLDDFGSIELLNMVCSLHGYGILVRFKISLMKTFKI